MKLTRLLAVVLASALAVPSLATAVSFPSTYRKAKTGERAAMSRAARTAKDGLAGTKPFAWYIGRKDGTWGYVCGTRDGETAGVPLRRSGGTWRATAASSGALQNADAWCRG